MSYTDIDCEGCLIVKVCEFPVKMDEFICPCSICLVKMVCEGFRACRLFHDYEAALIKKIKETNV